jgi:hypothetical protein
MRAKTLRTGLSFTLPAPAAPGLGAAGAYAGRTTTFVLTGVREYRCIMS